jgi:hypothetical protein
MGKSGLGNPLDLCPNFDEPKIRSGPDLRLDPGPASGLAEGQEFWDY